MNACGDFVLLTPLDGKTPSGLITTAHNRGVITSVGGGVPTDFVCVSVGDVVIHTGQTEAVEDQIVLHYSQIVAVIPNE